jgi:hypothetical protein
MYIFFKDAKNTLLMPVRQKSPFFFPTSPYITPKLHQKKSFWSTNNILSPDLCGNRQAVFVVFCIVLGVTKKPQQFSSQTENYFTRYCVDQSITLMQMSFFAGDYGT